MRPFFVILLVVFCSLIKGQNILRLKKGNDCPPHIGKHISIYIDETALQTINEVTTPGAVKQFTASSHDILNFNITKSAIWCKFSATSPEQGDWLVQYTNSSNNKIDLYTFKNGGLIRTQHGGIPYPKEERTLVGGHILFDLDLKPGDTLTYFLRSVGSGPMVIALRAADIRSFFEEDHTLNLLHGMFYGIMFLMVLYNLFLFFTNRNKVYIYYIFYIIFSTLFIAFFIGYIYVLPEFFLFMFNRFPVLVPALFGFFGLLFTVEFLNTKKLAPKLHKAIMVFIMLVLLPVFLAISGYPHESVAIIQVFGIVLAIISFATGITVLRKGYRPAKFYVVGFGAYMLGLVILIVTNATHISIGGIEAYSLEIGSAIEAIMLSFAIGDKLNIANYENEKLIREQNTMLEQKVKERTAELEEQKDIVEEKNKEITDSIKYAKRIQTALLPSDKYFEKHFKGLKK